MTFLTDLADVCRSTGRPVVEVDGWESRARGSNPDGYGSGRPNHLMVHHTASGPGSDGWPDVNYCTFGDDDAPLCNLYLARDGTIYVCAGGPTNTNGSGTDPCHTTADDSMNSAAVGIEAGNDGRGEPWADAQCQAYLELCAVLCEAYQIPFGRIHAHFEWAPTRKVDPAGPSPWATGTASWDMDRFRGDAADLALIPIDPDESEDDMPLSDDDVERIAAAVWAREFSVPDRGAEPAGWIIGQTYGLSSRAARAAEEAAGNTR